MDVLVKSRLDIQYMEKLFQKFVMTVNFPILTNVKNLKVILTRLTNIIKVLFSLAVFLLPFMDFEPELIQ